MSEASEKISTKIQHKLVGDSFPVLDKNIFTSPINNFLQKTKAKSLRSETTDEESKEEFYKFKKYRGQSTTGASTAATTKPRVGRNSFLTTTTAVSQQQQQQQLFNNNNNHGNRGVE